MVNYNVTRETVISGKKRQRYGNVLQESFTFLRHFAILSKAKTKVWSWMIS